MHCPSRIKYAKRINNDCDPYPLGDGQICLKMSEDENESYFEDEKMDFDDPLNDDLD